MEAEAEELVTIIDIITIIDFITKVMPLEEVLLEGTGTSTAIATTGEDPSDITSDLATIIAFPSNTATTMALAWEEAFPK